MKLFISIRIIQPLNKLSFINLWYFSKGWDTDTKQPDPPTPLSPAEILRLIDVIIETGFIGAERRVGL